LYGVRTQVIQLIMFCGIGLLAGCLVTLPLVPLVHYRAVRLTTRNMIDATPFAMTEIRAQKDQLRAQFAMAIRRLEVNMEDLKTKGTHYAAEMGRKQAESCDLKVELHRSVAMITDLKAELSKAAAVTTDLRIELDKRTAELFALRGEKESAVEARRGVAIDILDGGLMVQPGIADPGEQALLAPIADLAVEN
jgi:uncharacterized membrane protein YccC